MRAGLIFLGYRRVDLIEAANRTAVALKALRQTITTVRSGTETQAIVETARFRIRLTLCEDVVVPSLHVPADVVLRIEIAPSDHPVETSDREWPRDTVLAQVVKTLHENLRSGYVQWIDEQAVLSASDFVMATTLPHDAEIDPPHGLARVKPPHGPLPRIEDVHAALDHRLERTGPPEYPEVELPFDAVDGVLDGIIEDIPEYKQVNIESIREENDKLRLSAWLLSIAVACIALPLGLALMIVNLVKGENLRLASQAAALSGVFVSLDANGATANALQAVQQVLN